MSITFSAKINLDNYPKKKVFVEDKYGCDSFADAHYFENDPYVFVDEETKRFYLIEEDIDFVYEANFSNDNAYSILSAIDHNLYVLTKNDGYGSVKHEDLPEFNRKLIKAMNSSGNAGVREGFVSGNMHSVGLTKDGVTSRIEQLLEIVKNAQRLNVDVVWG